MTYPTERRSVPRELNSTYKLLEEDRLVIAILVALDLWPKARIAKEYDVSPRTVVNCYDRYRGARLVFR